MIDLLTILQRHFPAEGDKIRQRLNEDPILQEIEENYRDCIAALQHWRQSKEPEANARIVEYSSISRELEQEALNAFEAHVLQSRT